MPLNKLRRRLNGVFLIALDSAAWREEDAGEDEASVDACWVGKTVELKRMHALNELWGGTAF